MTNKEKLFWGLGVLVLVILFLMSSTDLIIKEKEIQVYPVSVILSRETDEYYGNLKKGIDLGAEDFHTDVKLITLYTSNNHQQQMELLQREIRDGARAVILEPVSEKDMIMDLEAMNPSCPVILLGASAASQAVTDAVSRDDYEAGRMLAGAVLKEISPDMTVYLFGESLSLRGTAEVYDGVRSVLEEQGHPWQLFEKTDQDTYRRAIEEMVYPGNQEAAVIALDVQTLDQVSAIMEESTVYQEHIKGLYGMGCSLPSILNRTEQGIIRGMVVYDQFTQGYLGVRRAVEAIQGPGQKQEYQLSPVYLDHDAMKDRQYEKLLYPIG